jgi:protease-4
MRRSAIVAILIIIVLFLISFGSSFILKNVDLQDQIVIIPITGALVMSNGDSLISQPHMSSDTILEYIQSADANKNIKAIILEINSPGGTALASKEVADAVKETNKPVIAFIREVGASGAYWVASSSDVIVADEVSITGSIGVIGSYLEFSGLMDQYGVEYERLVGGKYKDMGSNYRGLTSDEKVLLQNKINLIHELFIQEVKKNRNIPEGEWREGLFYLGSEAKQLGLIDVLGGRDDAIRIAKERAGIKDAKLVVLRPEVPLFDRLRSLATHIGYGMGMSFKFKSDSDNQILLQ